MATKSNATPEGKTSHQKVTLELAIETTATVEVEVPAHATDRSLLEKAKNAFAVNDFSMLTSCLREAKITARAGQRIVPRTVQGDGWLCVLLFDEGAEDPPEVIGIYVGDEQQREIEDEGRLPDEIRTGIKMAKW